ncbi:MAG: hypothetical protein ACLRMH_13610 [Lachnospiraceae bacterium]
MYAAITAINDGKVAPEYIDTGVSILDLDALIIRLFKETSEKNMLRQVCQPAGLFSLLHIEGRFVCICMDLILEAQNVQ